MLTVINASQVEQQVFIAIDESKFLPVGEKISLEHLDHGDDGIFQSVSSWKSFCNKNFDNDLKYCSGFYYDGELKESTRKKWSHKLEEYQDLFVVAIGGDKFTKVESNLLDFSFEYELQFNSNDITNGRGILYPSTVEFFVNATLKDA